MLPSLTHIPRMQIDIFKQTPEVKIHFIKAHGLLTLVDSLQAVRSREVIGLELRIVNLVRETFCASLCSAPLTHSVARMQLIANDPDTLEKLCVSGRIRQWFCARHARLLR